MSTMRALGYCIVTWGSPGENRESSPIEACSVGFDLIDLILILIYLSNGEGSPSAEVLIFKGPSHKLKLN